MEGPLFLEVASSLNTELVYIILKSITRFTYLKSGREREGGFGLPDAERNKEILDFSFDETTGDATIKLGKIKIENSQDWERRPSLPRFAGGPRDTIILSHDIYVTYYRIDTFLATFEGYFANFDLIFQSLAPQFNREMVFQAG